MTAPPCPACEARKAASRRGGLYQLGGMVDGVKVEPCAGCVSSSNAYSFKGCKEIKPIKGKK